MGDYTSGLADGKAKLRALKAKFACPGPAARALGLSVFRETSERAYISCPWHEEKTPSCCLSRVDWGLAVHCFGCGKHGDVVDLAAAKLGLSTRGRDFARVVSHLEQLQPQVSADPTSVASQRLSGTVDPHVFAVLAECISDLCPLEAEPDVAEYLRKRRILGAAHQARWGALPSSPARQAEIIAEVIATVGEKAWLGSGLALSDSALTFPNHRLVIPWRDPLGYTVNLQRRLIGEAAGQPKYVAPAGRPFAWPYGVELLLDAAADAEVMFVEGAVDAISVNVMTVNDTPPRVVLGLPGVGGWHAEWRHLSAGRRVVLGFDADAAGAQASARVARDLLFAAMVFRACKPASGHKDWADLLLHSEAS